MSKVPSALSSNWPLPDVPMSAVELAVFYPHHSMWPEYLLRFFRNGWTMALVAKAQLWARGALQREEYTKRSNALRKAKKTAGDNKYGVTNFVRISTHSYPPISPNISQDSSNPPFSGYAELKPFVALNQGQQLTSAQSQQQAQAYNPTQCTTPFTPPANITLSTTHPTLRMVQNGIVNFPTGDDAGRFTKVILWAKENHTLDLYTTAHVASIAANPANVLRDGRRVGGLPLEAFGNRWDQGCAVRMAAVRRGW
ncbi:uncharacterized protein RCC_05472 [Ramularia collo-cygni]|uniref:Uncharacterized protein n=1 Tax=Ramularia collo-cygni TaxID=112498 RepID=A0A2D3UTA2_9PEZI|nr:uncharacterized protein RCC_05472 [Ramularia collo-cygni]CZT19621.1 uncharacterized protein RCC_05472 [Ramularia collo-cygni]